MRYRAVISEILEYIFPPPKKRHALLHANPEALREIFPQASSDTPNFVTALFDYSAAPVRELVSLLKFAGDARAARISAQLLHEALIDILQENITRYETVPRLVPIPLAREERLERGYNQCNLLVQNILHLDAAGRFAGANNTLRKPHPTTSQTEMPNKKQRRENVRGCFIVKNRSRIEGTDIILIDDVITTGATLEEARNVLQDAGAGNVFALTLAH